MLLKKVLHRQHFPFGGLKPLPTFAERSRAAVAPSALPLRGTETLEKSSNVRVSLTLHRQHFPFGGLKLGKRFLPKQNV